MSELYIPAMFDFNRNEEDYDTLIVMMLFSMLLKSLDSLNSPVWADSWKTGDLDPERFIQDSGLSDSWKSTVDSTVESAGKHVSSIYDRGRRAAFRELGKTTGYTQADHESLKHLKDYNEVLLRSVAADFTTAIRASLEESEGLPLNEASARLMNAPLDVVPGTGVSARTRARMIARTEHGRALNNGVLQAYADMGVDQVDVVTAGDEHVCSICVAIAAANPYSLEEAAGLLPVHPNCRCSFAVARPRFNYNPPARPRTVSMVDPEDRRGDKEHM